MVYEVGDVFGGELRDWEKLATFRERVESQSERVCVSLSASTGDFGFDDFVGGVLDGFRFHRCGGLVKRPDLFKIDSSAFCLVDN